MSRRNTRLILLLGLFIACGLHTSLPAQSKFRKYLHFLKGNPDSTIRTLIFMGMDYQYIAPGRVTDTGHGLVIHGGINLARFFSRKLHVGIYGSYKARELLWPCHFNRDFATRLGIYSDYSALGFQDSIIARYFVGGPEPGGSGRFLYGLSFHLPIRFFPVIRVYRGRTVDLLSASDQTSGLTGDEDWTYFHYQTSGAELSVFHIHSLDPEEWWPPFSVTLFMERNNFARADINDIRLSSFLDPLFFQASKPDYRFGIKVGIDFW